MGATARKSSGMLSIVGIRQKRKLESMKTLNTRFANEREIEIKLEVKKPMVGGSNAPQRRLGPRIGGIQERRSAPDCSLSEAFGGAQQAAKGHTISIRYVHAQFLH
jgi:hypothetical protein